MTLGRVGKQGQEPCIFASLLFASFLALPADPSCGIHISRPRRPQQAVTSRVSSFPRAAETAEQPDSKACSEYVLNEGSFQIPIYRTGLKQGQPLTARALDSSPMRPCSSVLVRIVRAQRAQDGVQVLTSKDIDVGEDELERLKLLIRPKPYHVADYASHRYLICPTHATSHRYMSTAYTCSQLPDTMHSRDHESSSCLSTLYHFPLLQSI